MMLSAITPRHQAAAAAAAGVASANGEYLFAEHNPFLGDAAAFDKGKDLFKRGLLSEAALALEAEVRLEAANRDVAAFILPSPVEALLRRCQAR